MENIVRLKDGKYACVVHEWNWKDHPYLKIYESVDYKTRLYEDFLDLELDGRIRTHKIPGCGPLPLDSNFHRVNMTVCKKDVEFIDSLVDYVEKNKILVTEVNI